MITKRVPLAWSKGRFSEGDLYGVGGCVFIYIKSLGGVYNTRTKLNPGAALEEPEHQGIRSINAQAPS